MVCKLMKFTQRYVNCNMSAMHLGIPMTMCNNNDHWLYMKKVIFKLYVHVMVPLDKRR